LHENANPTAVDGMEKYGISPEAVGISIPVLRSIAKEIGNDHELPLSQRMWSCKHCPLAGLQWLSSGAAFPMPSFP